MTKKIIFWDFEEYGNKDERSTDEFTGFSIELRMTGIGRWICAIGAKGIFHGSILFHLVE